MKKQKPFNDFFLLGLPHLDMGEIFGPGGSIREEAKREMERRVAFGKRAIRQYTKRGDLIGFETPFRWTFEQYKTMRSLLGKATKSPVSDKRLRFWWDGIVKKYLSFYAEMAEYAESIGRKPVSLEPSARKPASRAYRLLAGTIAGSQAHQQADFLITRRADRAFLKKIQAMKPKMVVVSDGHAVVLENILDPRQVEYFPRISEKTKGNFLRYVEARARRYEKNRGKRLARKRELARRKRRR